MGRKGRKKKRRKLTKSKSLRIHTAARSAQRYGIKLDGKLYRSVIDTIQLGGSQFLERQSNARSVHLVQVMGREIPVVYDRNRKEIVTVLPQEYIQDLRNGRSVC